MNFKILLEASKIEARVKELGEEISQAFGGREIGDEVLIIGVLRGSFVFLADLVRAIETPVKIDFIEASSYGAGTESSGEVKVHRNVRETIEGKDILIVEDIVDTGITLTSILGHFQQKNPRSMRVCSLLHKPSREVKKVPISFLGFTIEDHFVVGYGLDVDERYRQLKDVVIYSKEVEEKGEANV